MVRANGPKFNLSYRRRRKKITDYKKRLALLKSGKPRLVVRKTNKRIIAQIIGYNPDGDQIIVDVDSTMLRSKGWVDKPNVPTAYLTGYLCGVQAVKKGVKEFVLDIGMVKPTKSSVIFSAMKGAFDAGLKTAFDSKIIVEDRLHGKHISEYAKTLKTNESKYKSLFSNYIKAGVDPEKIPELFEKVKAGLGD